MEILKAKIEDLEAIKALEDKCFKHPYSKKDLEYEMFENPVANFLILKENGEIAGFIDYWITFDSSTVAQICVDTKYRRKGLATSLAKYMIDDLKRNEVLASTLEVRKSNIEAQSFYKSLGYYQVVVKENYYVDGEDAIYMLLEVVNV